MSAALLLGAAPRLAGASRLVATPSFDLVVQRSLETVDRNQPLQLDVTIAPHADASDVELQIRAISGAPLSRRQFPIKVQSDDLHHYTAVASFPERGAWNLRFTTILQSGATEMAFMPLTVTDPRGMPPSLAWLIGFSPLAVLGIFALSEAARAQTGRVP